MLSRRATFCGLALIGELAFSGMSTSASAQSTMTMSSDNVQMSVPYLRDAQTGRSNGVAGVKLVNPGSGGQVANCDVSLIEGGQTRLGRTVSVAPGTSTLAWFIHLYASHDWKVKTDCGDLGSSSTFIQVDEVDGEIVNAKYRAEFLCDGNSVMAAVTYENHLSTVAVEFATYYGGEKRNYRLVEDTSSEQTWLRHLTAGDTFIVASTPGGGQRKFTVPDACGSTSKVKARVWADKTHLRRGRGTYVHWDVDPACGDVRGVADPYTSRWGVINFTLHPTGKRLFYPKDDQMFGIESDGPCNDWVTIHVKPRQ